MSFACRACGGLALDPHEQGQGWGYSGKWCLCPRPTPPASQPSAAPHSYEDYLDTNRQAAELASPCHPAFNIAPYIDLVRRAKALGLKVVKPDSQGRAGA